MTSWAGFWIGLAIFAAVCRICVPVEDYIRQHPQPAVDYSRCPSAWGC